MSLACLPPAAETPARGLRAVSWAARDRRKWQVGQGQRGPSKGGSLNNRSFEYTVLYLCYAINGVYDNNILFMNIIYYSGNHLY